MVARQPLLEAMLDEPGRTLRTFEPMAARAAERQRRVTTTIEEQQRLLAFFERFGHRRDETRGEPFSRFQLFPFQIDDRNVRHRDAGEAARKDRMAVASDERIDVALDRRGCGCQHDRELAEIATHHGHVAALIVHAIFLLESLIVLLVDDDEAELTER